MEQTDKMIEVAIKGKKRFFDSEEDHNRFKKISQKLQHYIGDERRTDYNLDDYIDEKIRRLTEEVHIFFCNIQLGMADTDFFIKEFRKAF